MHGHMLKYHVGVPLAVFAVLVVIGIPAGSAVGYAIAAGCVSMVFMMAGGGHRPGHRASHHRSSGARPSTPQR